MTSKHKMVTDSVDTLYGGYWERWRFAILTFTYCSKGQGEAYILTYKTNAHGFALIANLSLVSSGGLFRIATSR